MAQKTCPDCKARVPRELSECPHCGRRMRPPPAPGPAPPRARHRWRDRALLVAAAICVLLVIWLIAATVPESEARARQREVAVATSLAALRDLRAVEEALHRRTGSYGGWLDRLDTLPGAPPGEMDGLLFVRKSTDGQAWIATHSLYDARVECGQLVRNGPETAWSRDLWESHPWLIPNAPPRCRKSGLPWVFLHWAGVGYLTLPDQPAPRSTLTTLSRRAMNRDPNSAAPFLSGW